MVFKGGAFDFIDQHSDGDPDGEDQQYAGGPGITGADRVIENIMQNPYMNETAKQQALAEYNAGNFAQYNTTRAQGQDPFAYGAGQTAASTAGATGAGAGATGAGGTQQQRDALILVRTAIRDYGLPDSLADWAWSQIVGGRSQAEVLLELQQRPEFKNEYPEIDQRLQKGLAPLSPGEIISYRQQARQMMRAAGLPEGFYDSKDDFARYLTEDLSVKELGDRISIAAQAAFAAPPEDRAEARRLGFTDGDWVAMALDPDVAEPLLQKRWAASQLSGTAVRSGYGGLERDEALALAEQGVTQGQAQQGFAQLGQSRELFGVLDAGEDEITRQEQLGATFSGNARAQQRVEERARRRRAQFQRGGGFAGGQNGLTGLGGGES